MVNPVENPPLFNTITPYHQSTTSQDNHNTSLPYNHTTLPPQDCKEEVPSEKNKEEEMEKEFGKPMEEKPFGENGVNGESEQKSKNEIDAKENPSQSQSLDINPNGESQDSITSGFQVEESSTDGSSECQSFEEETSEHQKAANTSTQQRQLSRTGEIRKWAREQEEKYKDTSCPAEKVLQNLSCENHERFRTYVQYLKRDRCSIYMSLKELIDDLVSFHGIDMY